MGKTSRQDLSGQIFGPLRVLYKTDKKGRLSTYYMCQCKCGNVHEQAHRNIKKQRKHGCKKCRKGIALSHGESNTNLYARWLLIKRRCSDQKFINFHDYGKRGITVCDEWNNDFLVFKKWAEEAGFAENLTIDRIDVNGNYEPSNCRWITIQEQAHNKRTSLLYTINSVTKTVAQWSDHYAINRYTVYKRLEKGIPILDALTLPTERKGSKKRMREYKMGGNSIKSI